MLTSRQHISGEVEIKRGIFQDDHLALSLFVLVIIPLTEILKKMKCGFSLGKDRSIIDYLLYMDDLNLYGKNMREIN